MAYSCLDTSKTLDKTISSLDMQLAVARASKVKNNDGDLQWLQNQKVSN